MDFDRHNSYILFVNIELIEFSSLRHIALYLSGSGQLNSDHNRYLLE